ncbi:hypothetical protein HHL16_16320 [Pseudoflavitalea sp. G-6-1-2]|uniref:chemotaxis protein CheB n=1 Tax=Pseudoflavitalea sp. G-6-1-2 TaxID=2728841 RepID=UPI00146BEEF8|nr:chemotaxis protein CheB [Pseudoflavitalea sp. G-6-1-2]NML22451.1 hypothetical protein [Pseudoflavitalea sp. G-6-1-2]
MKKNTTRITQPAKSAKRKASPASSTPSFPIVAIGASAGGLEAINKLLQNLPPDTGMAFIYVQHLSPDHESMLSSLLAKSTKMKVQEVKNGMTIAPNNLYVIPPDKEMKVTDGYMRLSPRPKKPKFNLPIDKFFTSLASAHKENVIGIILSGSATDGTLGLKAIKQEGGLTMAQDDSAKFSSMPESAIAAGIIDLILSPDKMALELAQMSRHPFIRSNGHKEIRKDDIDDDSPDLKMILTLLQKASGVDFRLYKMNTIKRRISRRMVLYKLKTLKEYVNLLIEQKGETDILFQDLLITVTNFFRDAEACTYLKATLLPRLFKNKSPGDALRIWIPACSTGEEAYSMAMIILEMQDSKFQSIPVQIFATDLNAQAISKARIAIYSKQEVENVSPKRLQRFFTRSDGGYRIAQSVRDICVFAPHNVLSDPPFSRIDLVSCCNLMIYFDTAAQKRAMATFHYALNPDGYLQLSKTETIGGSTELFAHLNKKFKIYLRKKTSRNWMLPPKETRYTEQPAQQPGIKKLTGNTIYRPSKALSAEATSFINTIDSLLLSRYVPASVVVNQQLDILQFRGLTDPYLAHPAGKATLNVLKMIRPEIAFELRNAITKAFKTKQLVRKQGIEINGGAAIITLEVLPLTSEWNESLLLIVFMQQLQDERLVKGKKETSATQNNRRIKKLEEEIAAYQDELRMMSQNHEAAMEELQSANEEVVSSNEELRSINEELETSKEEIQSASEELATSNQELQTRNELLNESYLYSEAIIATIHEPMMILDKQLRVKTANKAFYKKFAVNAGATEGICLYDLGDKQWDVPVLRAMLEDILQKGTSFYDLEIEQSFPGIGKKILRLNAKPIIQPTHREQLISLAIYDVTEIITVQRNEKRMLEDRIDVQKKTAEESKKADDHIIQEQKVQSHKFEQAVQLRTEELHQANELLEEKNNSLKSINKELEAFAYVSSHDLQEPLRKIQTFAHLITETESKTLSPKGKHHLDRMIIASGQMQTLIEDLLAFARISIGESQIETIDLSPIMESIVISLKEVIDEKKVTMEVKEMCKARIIPFQFQQLMRNLINNSIKFASPSRSPHIIIEATLAKGSQLNIKDLLPQKSYCHLSITDNGIGFEQEFGEQVFEVFQRLHSKETYPGTGIGLAIAKKIVENHHGIITATSELDKGARFDIYLPG